MARIPDAFIQDLLNRVDIVDVVERYLPLKKGGQNYMACCPFHKEKSPSFTVSPAKQFYHCFGCGVHGSAIGFVMEYEGLGFQEAVTKLAESVGMAMPKLDADSQAAPRRALQTSLVELNTRAMHFYRQQLKSNVRAIDYLKRRGLSGQIAARFGLGFAPDDWHPLAACFSDYATNPQLAEAGLVVDHADTGRRYDRFRDRIIFPILDGKSQVIGFGGRVIDKGEPKYLNSPETPLFQKGLELYGLPQARQAIRAANRVLVVEGYMDVVALAQLGVEYAVATLGTACTPEHVKKLLRLADQVVFCFDGDAAGRRAAWRGLENSLAQVSDGKTLSFLFLPPEHDPDSYIREHGKEAFEALIDREAMGLVAFMTRELAGQVDLATEEGRARFLHLAKPLAEQITAPVLSVMLRKKLADMTGLDMASASSLLGGAKGAAASARQSKRREDRVPAPAAAPPSADIALELLQLLLIAPELAHDLPHVELEFAAQSSAFRLLIQVADRLLEMDKPPRSGHLLEMLREHPNHALLEAMLQQATQKYPADDLDSLRQVWRDALPRWLSALDKAPVEQRIAELDAKGWQKLNEAEKEEFRRLTAQRHV